MGVSPPPGPNIPFVCNDLRAGKRSGLNFRLVLIRYSAHPLAYPGLDIEVGGYTDNVGGDEMNQKLSENRANSVRDYLVQEGVTAGSVSAKGFGNTLPVASH